MPLPAVPLRKKALVPASLLRPLLTVLLVVLAVAAAVARTAGYGVPVWAIVCLWLIALVALLLAPAAERLAQRARRS